MKKVKGPGLGVLERSQKTRPNDYYFIFNKKGISQRDCRTFYKYIHDKKDKIIQLIENFYVNNIHEKFYDSSFTFDVYIKKNVSLM
jgi:hypothetical protein